MILSDRLSNPSRQRAEHTALTSRLILSSCFLGGDWTSAKWLGAFKFNLIAQKSCYRFVD